MFKLPDAVVAALIAFSGVGISVLLAWVTSLRTFRVEVGKAYWPKLLEKRVDTYPELYSYLSDFSKISEQRELSLSELEVLRDKIDSWDSENALFLGRNTVNVCHNFRVVLARTIREAGSTNGVPKAELLLDLLDRGSALKQGLRSDLGIYGFAASGNDITLPPKGW